MTRPLMLFAALALVSRQAAAADPSKKQCVEANSSAQDLRRDGRLQSAREKLAICVAASCPGAVRSDCAERLDEVDKAMPSLLFEVKDGAGNDLAAVRIAMDGQLLTQKTDGTAIPIDPGTHRFTFEFPGLSATAKTFVVREGDKGRRERVVLRADRPTEPQLSGQGGAIPRPTPPDRGSQAPVAAYVAFGVAGVGLVAGAVFTGFWANSKRAGDAACSSGTCSPQAAGSHESEQTNYSVALACGFGFAAVGTALGILLLAQSASAGGQGEHASRTVSVSPELGVGWAGIKGRF